MSIEKMNGKPEIAKNGIEKKAEVDNERLDWWKNIAVFKVEDQKHFESKLEKKLRPNNTEHLEKTAQLDEQRLA